MGGHAVFEFLIILCAIVVETVVAICTAPFRWFFGSMRTRKLKREGYVRVVGPSLSHPWGLLGGTEVRWIHGSVVSEIEAIRRQRSVEYSQTIQIVQEERIRCAVSGTSSVMREWDLENLCEIAQNIYNQHGMTLELSLISRGWEDESARFARQALYDIDFPRVPSMPSLTTFGGRNPNPFAGRRRKRPMDGGDLTPEKPAISYRRH